MSDDFPQLPISPLLPDLSEIPVSGIEQQIVWAVVGGEAYWTTRVSHDVPVWRLLDERKWWMLPYVWEYRK